MNRVRKRIESLVLLHCKKGCNDNCAVCAYLSYLARTLRDNVKGEK